MWPCRARHEGSARHGWLVAALCAQHGWHEAPALENELVSERGGFIKFFFQYSKILPTQRSLDIRENEDRRIQPLLRAALQ